MPHAVLVLCLLHQTGRRRRRAFKGGLKTEEDTEEEEDEKGEEGQEGDDKSGEGEDENQ